MKATSTTIALLSLAGAVVGQSTSSTSSTGSSRPSSSASASTGSSTSDSRESTAYLQGPVLQSPDRLLCMYWLPAFIPSSGISSQCSSFLVALDKNTELATCSNSLLSATSLFSPASSSHSSSSSDISAALNKLCSAQSSCNDDAIKQSLTWFSGNCSAELQSGNDVVKSNYDVLYVLSPFTDAVCSKDSASGKYCALQIGQASGNSTAASASNSTAGTPSGAQQLIAQTYEVPHIQISTLYVNLASAAKNALNRLRRRGPTGSTATTVSANGGDDSALMPNSTTFRSTNLPFLFVSGDMSTAQLCTTCTKAVLAAYVGFETEFPYGEAITPH